VTSDKQGQIYIVFHYSLFTGYWLLVTNQTTDRVSTHLLSHTAVRVFHPVTGYRLLITFLTLTPSPQHLLLEDLQQRLRIHRSDLSSFGQRDFSGFFGDNDHQRIGLLRQSYGSPVP
jgi:hypothetical protein